MSDEALRVIDERRPDLVLMDIRISGASDGIQTAGLLRSRYRLPVVYLTANADAETLERALATAPAGYLVKPYNPHSLRTTIEIAFRRARPRRRSTAPTSARRRSSSGEPTRRPSACAGRAAKRRSIR